MAEELTVINKALDQQGLVRRQIDRFRGSRNAYLDFGAGNPQTVIYTNPAEATRTRVIAIYIHSDNAGEINFFDGNPGTKVFPTIEVAANTNVSLDIEDLGGGIVIATSLSADPTTNEFEVFVSYLYEKDVPED